jgi:hypothetical protein
LSRIAFLLRLAKSPRRGFAEDQHRAADIKDVRAELDALTSG